MTEIREFESHSDFDDLCHWSAKQSWRGTYSPSGIKMFLQKTFNVNRVHKNFLVKPDRLKRLILCFLVFKLKSMSLLYS